MIRIILPTDFSSNSLNALSYAQLLFKNTEVEFILLNAFWPLTSQPTDDTTAQPVMNTSKSMERQSLKNLEALKSDIENSNENLHHSYTIKTYGGHLKEVVKKISREDYDYIIMGSKGATGLKEIFVGSVTYSIVALHQKIPLLIIPEKAVFVTPKTIGFATDFERDYSRKELQPLVFLTKLWASILRMVEVYEKSEIVAQKKEHIQHLENLLVDVDYKFHIVPAYSSLENCINVFNEELGIDIMVLIDYPKNFFKRLEAEPVIKKMSFHTTLPFLILPADN